MKKIEKCEKALSKLKEFLAEPHMSEAAKSGVIQAFEFTFEVFWQYFQACGKYSGRNDIGGPRHAFVFAYGVGFIENSEAWIDIMKSRNNTSHTYNEKIAEEIFQKIRDVYQYEFEKALEKMKVKAKEFNEI